MAWWRGPAAPSACAAAGPRALPCSCRRCSSTRAAILCRSLRSAGGAGGFASGFSAPPDASPRLAILAGPMADSYIKEYLMTAGPTPLPPRVSQVMAEPMVYHRAPAFVEVYARVLERLKAVFQTRGDVLVFAASGSGAMESAVANLVRPGEPAVVASCGKFGERWAELCDAYGANTRHLEFEWGTKV